MNGKKYLRLIIKWIRWSGKKKKLMIEPQRTASEYFDDNFKWILRLGITSQRSYEMTKDYFCSSFDN